VNSMWCIVSNCKETNAERPKLLMKRKRSGCLEPPGGYWVFLPKFKRWVVVKGNSPFRSVEHAS
jgi:hypothetical protein